VLYPESLCPSHVVLGLIPYLLQLVQVFRGQGKITDGPVPISMRMIAHQKKEGGLPGHLASPIVMGKFSNGKVLGPVVLSVVDEEPEIGFYPLVILFGLSVRTWVVSCGDVLLNIQQSTQFLCEF
jgi:hypothetical protein